MGKARPLRGLPDRKVAQLLAADVASDQWGVISGKQLRDCGVTKSTTESWLKRGRLHLLHSGVYAVGHRSLAFEGRLVAALLYAGRDALLSHVTAAWWWGLISEQPPIMELSAPRRVIRSNGVVVHRRTTRLDSTRHRRFPITSVAQTLLDYASMADLLDVRRALAQADYLRLLDRAAVDSALAQGRPGTAILRTALGQHQPMLARARSWLEVAFVPLCEAAGIPMPELNARVAGWTVDALWREERVVVELDGYDNHSTRAQMERDRRKELDLRVTGFLVIRYTRAQVLHQPELVAADLLARLAERQRLAG
jgi:hypothetical protein